MPLEVLYEGGYLVAALVAAFAISSIVGILIARVWAPTHRLGREPYQPRERDMRWDRQG